MAVVAIAYVCDAHAALLDAIEFYDATLDHYFITASADEIAKLDGGFFVGWQRTGLSFKVEDPAANFVGLSPVCRFYGLPLAGLDSHFYSASPAECAAVMQRFPNAWELESSDVFQVRLPDLNTGVCPSGSVPVYRSWNARTDSNHRYTTDPSVQQAMIAKGYVAEGYGPPPMPVAMCSPTVEPGAVPVCQLTASATSAQLGTPVTLTGTCTGNPTSYTWTGCSSFTSNCTAYGSSAGAAIYTLVANSSGGASTPASVTITWLASQPPGAPPSCKLNVTAQSETPAVGALVALNADCGGTVTAYTWTNCTSGTNVCLARGQAPGPVTYTVTASNASGGSTVGVTVNWASTPQPPSGLCGQFPSALYSNVNSQYTAVYSLFYPDLPGFAWNGAWAIRFAVPATAQAGQFGSVSAAEYGGPPTVRDITISQVACDFRPADPSGANGPFEHSYGVGAQIIFSIATSTPGNATLQAGGTYYLNVRNFDPSSGTISCSPSQQRCDAIGVVRLPGG